MLKDNIDYRKKLESLGFTCSILSRDESSGYACSPSRDEINLVDFCAIGKARVTYVVRRDKYNRLKSNESFINDVWYRLYSLLKEKKCINDE